MGNETAPSRPYGGSSAYRGNDRRSLTDLRGTYYGGPDRRLAAAFRTQSLPVQVTLWLTGGAALAAVVARAYRGGSQVEVTTFTNLRNASAVLLVLTGALLLVVWALSGGARQALDGCALLVLGGGSLVLAGPWGSWFHHAGPLATLSPSSCIALTVPALFLLIRSTVTRQVDSATRPLSTLARTALVVAGLLGVEAVRRNSALLQGTRLWETLLIGAVIGWVIAGGRRLVPVPGEPAVPGTTAMGFALLGLGLADALVAGGLGHGLHWGLVGVAFQVVAAAVAARVAASQLLRAMSHDSIRRLQLAGQVADLSIVLADEKRVRQRMVRDARSLMKAVRHTGGAAERTVHPRNDVPTSPGPAPAAEPVSPPIAAAAAYSDPPPTTSRTWRL